MIKRLLKKNYLTSAQARTAEIFLLWLLFSFAFWVLDNVEVIMNWWSVDRKAFLLAFSSTTTSAIFAWLKKYLRDLQKSIN